MGWVWRVFEGWRQALHCMGWLDCRCGGLTVRGEQHVFWWLLWDGVTWDGSQGPELVLGLIKFGMGLMYFVGSGHRGIILCIHPLFAPGACIG